MAVKSAVKGVRLSRFKPSAQGRRTGHRTRNAQFKTYGVWLAALGLTSFSVCALGQQAGSGVVADKITVIGTRALTPAAITISAGVQTGDRLTDDALEALRQRLVTTGMFGMHHLDDPDEAVRVRMETAGFPKGHGELIIIVDENDVIKSLSITGSGPVSTDEILKHLHTTGVFRIYITLVGIWPHSGRSSGWMPNTLG
jgi:outer membrane protein assembly factor BamA